MIKIDEFIESLQRIREEHGNLPILISDNTFGYHTNFSKLPEYQLQYFGNEEGLVNSDVLLYAKERDFLINSPTNRYGDNKVVMINTGGLIYRS